MNQTLENTSIIILAAGMGTRMKSEKAKVLHRVLGRPMVHYVIDAAREVDGRNIILVIGNQAEQVKKEVSAAHTRVRFAHQEEQLGTGHAVLCAMPYIPDYCDEVLILYGDVPLIRHDTILNLIRIHRKNNLDVTVMAAETDNPGGYGRLILKGETVEKIVEEADATPAQKNINIINTGIYCVKKAFLIESLKRIKSTNVQGEFYLTDIIEIGTSMLKKVGYYLAPDDTEFQGINTPDHLKNAEALMRNRECIKP